MATLVKETTFQITGTVVISGSVTVGAFSSTTVPYTVATQAAVNVPNSADTALRPANVNRKLLFVCNPATTPLFIAFGAAASATSGVRVPAGGSLVLESNELRTWQGTVRGFQASGLAVDVNLMELDG